MKNMKSEESIYRIETMSCMETVNAGKELGEKLKAGDVVFLNGEMGTGKTEFTKGIALGLSVEDYVVSPTFTIVNEYKGRLPFYHFDVYRIAGADEMYEIGFEEYIYGNGVSVIEWAELIDHILPSSGIYVNIEKNNDISYDYRKITVKTINGARNGSCKM